MEPLKLELTIDETKVILEALNQMPFTQVSRLIHKINEQAKAQLNS